MPNRPTTRPGQAIPIQRQVQDSFFIGTAQETVDWAALSRTMALPREWRTAPSGERARVPAPTLRHLSLGKTEVLKDEDMSERLVNNFTIGCDPEFMILDKSNVIHGARFGLGARGEVGYDHGGYVMEIRPAPARGSYTLVKRIQKALKENPGLKKANDMKWRGGAVFKAKPIPEEGQEQPRGMGRDGLRVYTLGGHVHLDMPPLGHGGDSEIHDERIDALDRVTKYLEGLDILPQSESQARRQLGARNGANTAYGQWSDWRPAGDGAGGRFRMEYRTPASWLFDPKAAFLTLTASKLAAMAPQLALDTLKARSVSFENLKEFFEYYKFRDTNARRAVEKVLAMGLKKIQADPEADIKQAWEKLTF